MVMPRPGSVWDCPDSASVTVLVVNSRLAMSSRVPKTLAHQQSEQPQPSQTPREFDGLTAVV